MHPHKYKKMIGLPAKQVEQAIRPIIFLILVIAIYIFVNKAIKAYRLRNVGRATYNPNNVNSNTNYDNIAAAIYRATDSGVWVWKDTAAIEKQAEILSSYNDDEIKLIYNRYNSLYGKAGDSGTMYSAFDIFCLTCPAIKSLLRRMERLGLN
jgi:hypothetical protein